MRNHLFRFLAICTVIYGIWAEQSFAEIKSSSIPNEKRFFQFQKQPWTLSGWVSQEGSARLQIGNENLALTLTSNSLGVGNDGMKMLFADSSGLFLLEGTNQLLWVSQDGSWSCTQLQYDSSIDLEYAASTKRGLIAQRVRQVADGPEESIEQNSRIKVIDFAKGKIISVGEMASFKELKKINLNFENQGLRLGKELITYTKIDSLLNSEKADSMTKCDHPAWTIKPTSSKPKEASIMNAVESLLTLQNQRLSLKDNFVLEVSSSKLTIYKQSGDQLSHQDSIKLGRKANSDDELALAKAAGKLQGGIYSLAKISPRLVRLNAIQDMRSSDGGLTEVTGDFNYSEDGSQLIAIKMHWKSTYFSKAAKENLTENVEYSAP